MGPKAMNYDLYSLKMSDIVIDIYLYAGLNPPPTAVPRAQYPLSKLVIKRVIDKIQQEVE